MRYTAKVLEEMHTCPWGYPIHHDGCDGHARDFDTSKGSWALVFQILFTVCHDLNPLTINCFELTLKVCYVKPPLNTSSSTRTSSSDRGFLG